MNNLKIHREELLLMGILNITPDSFSDGGKYLGQENAAKQLIKLIDEKTNIIDIGAESTKPGSTLIDEDEELKRLLPIIDGIKILPFTDVYFSLDTRKPKVAKLALESGFQIINDVSSLEYINSKGNNLAKVLADFPDNFLVLNHHRGIPPSKSYSKNNPEIMEEISEFFRCKIDFALQNGMSEKQIILDPGLGFGKSPEENILILCNLEKLKAKFNLPILIGPSRKRFVQKLWNLSLERQFPDSANILANNLDWASCVVSAFALNKGVNIIRCHEPSLFSGLKEIKKIMK
ncbi:MAG: dihydropteroate synthase [Candidatus Caenarcaniphilales bacterium]|nr:dihydropteroate synthase [Candidatus Caenarcaniphilales bacterium]